MLFIAEFVLAVARDELICRVNAESALGLLGRKGMDTTYAHFLQRHYES